jgi:hypothetical protein
MTTTHSLKRRLSALGGAIAAIATTVALLAPAAGADIKLCNDLDFTGSDDRSRCSTITGINPGSSLRVRAQPSLKAPILSERLRTGDVIEIECWTTGDRVKGNRYWVGIYGAGGPTFVSDFYVATGDPREWTKHFRPC